MTLPMEFQRERLASRTRRLIAQLIDDCIAFLPAVLVGVVLGGFGRPATALAALVYFCGFVYIVVSDGFPGGQSYGKRLMGIAVVDVESGQPCTYGQSIARNLLLAMLGPIDWLFIFGARRQRLGDTLARTMVVDR